METDPCNICDSETEFKYFEGEWKILYCPTCETEIKRSTSTVTDDTGLSKEDLRNLSNF